MHKVRLVILYAFHYEKMANNSVKELLDMLGSNGVDEKTTGVKARNSNVILILTCLMTTKPFISYFFSLYIPRLNMVVLNTDRRSFIQVGMYSLSQRMRSRVSRYSLCRRRIVYVVVVF